MKHKKLLGTLLAMGMAVNSAFQPLAPLARTMSFRLPGILSHAADIVASGKCGDNLTWTLDSEGTLAISGEGNMWDWGYDVPWYTYRETITRVILKDGVTSIGTMAFDNCSSLTNITIPDSVTCIGHCAFDYCTSLTSITIPDSVTCIGDGAFYLCTSLTDITIPDSVTWIGFGAFGNCTSLTSITISDSMESIDDGAFSFCTSLTSITIPDSVTCIGPGAFNTCTSLTEIVIPDSVTIIEGGAFSNCTNLTSITIPNSVTSIGNGAFSGCTNLTSITIPDSVTSIGEFAFSECSSLTNITIPNSVKSIGDSAFFHCTSLKEITIPDSVTSIGDSAFYCCTSLKEITIPNSVKSIGDSAFSTCDSLTEITIPNGVTSIGEYAFDCCTSLTSITISDSVTSIGAWAFSYCSSLKDITILNPECEINNLSCNTTIHGYTGSTAEKYAKNFDLDFVPLSEAPEKSDDIILTFEGKQYSMIKDYSPEWFAQNTSGRLYFPNLAYTEMLLAGSAYNGTEIVKNLKALGFENINETDTGYENTESFRMKNYVFDRDENNKLCDTTIKHIEKMNPNSVGYTIAKKKLDNGEDLVLVTIRGTITYDSIISDAIKPGTEWNSDFIPALEALLYPDGIHTGFSVPATAVYNDIKAMYGGKIKTDNVNYVVTGHSRGAGTANLVEKWLIDDGVPQGNMFCYNFACPDVDQKFELEFNPIDIKHGGNKYDCIYNFGVAGDPVTIVPGQIGNLLGIKTLDGLTTVWGKYGQTKWFSKNWVGQNGELGLQFSKHEPKNYVRMVSGFPAWSKGKSWIQYKGLAFISMGTAKQLASDGIDLTKKVVEKGGDTVVEYTHGMIGTAKDIGQTIPEFIAGMDHLVYNVGNTIIGWFFCPVDVEFYTEDGTYLAGIHGETVDYGEAFDDTIIIWNDGDKKYFAINTNQEIQIKLIGTDEGTMDCFIDTIPQGVLLSDSYVYYDAVPLVDGKVMTLTINESTAEYANKMSVYDENNNVSEIINPDIDVETSFYGDANGDYDFTIADAVLLSRIVAEDDVEVSDYGWRNADVNGDSIIDMNDVMALLNILSIGA